MNFPKSLMMAVFALAMTCLGCDEVQQDVVAYSKASSPIYNKFSTDIGQKMKDAQGLEDKAAYVAKTRNEILPLFKEFKDKMAAIKPETKPVQDIHNTYVAAIGTGAEGIAALADSIDKQDEALAKTAQAKLEASGKAEEKYKKDLEALAKEHGVPVK